MNVGIEIEFTGVKRENVARELATMWKTEVIPYDYNMYDGSIRHRFRVKDLCGNKWNIVMDKSIRPDCAHGHITLDYDEYMCELVSPVLRNKDDMLMLEMALGKICSMGGIVNETCGIHIHVDCPNTGEEVYRVFNKIATKQDSLMRQFGVSYNRIGRYCKLYSPSFIEGIQEWHEVCIKEKGYMSISDLQSYLYKELGEGCDRNDPKNPARYFIFNMDAIHKLNTLEFRWFNSTLSILIIQAYIKELYDLLGELL